MPLVAVALAVDRGKHTRAVMVAGLFAWFFFVLGTLTFDRFIGNTYYRPASHSNPFGDLFDALTTGAIVGFLGFCVTMACALPRWIGGLVALVVPGLAFAGTLISDRHDLIAQGEAANQAWAQLDVALRHRAGLIPGLLEMGNLLAAHEKQILTDLANAYAALARVRAPYERIAANERLDSALDRLAVVVKNYPQLKSNENFLRLRSELAGAENRIDIELPGYNEAVKRYNASVSRSKIAAGLFGFPIGWWNLYYRETTKPRWDVPQ